ncbi:hypothetical protein H6504_01345 [Candidatus Woesearchaeota archaeon]|nr:hypothetical protein [Candidatus Woesearchaeota archaeon]
MRKVWLGLTSLDNWDLIKGNQTYAFKKQISYQKVSVDDIIIFYIIPKSLGGIFKVVSKQVTNPIDFSGANYPYQILMEKILILDELLIIDDKFKNYQITDSISIFKNRIRWGTVLMGKDLIELKEDDYDFLLQVMQNEQF